MAAQGMRPASRPAVSRGARFAWAVLGWNLAVIVWGVYVRASGSGAGCGGNWPNCNGQWVIAGPMPFRMFVEYSHRLSTLVAALLIVGLVGVVLRGLAPGHPARKSALVALGCLVVEALLGAALVVHPASVLVLTLHQLNTLLLIAGLSLTAAWMGAAARPRHPWPRCPVFLLAVGLGGLGLTAVFGVVAALADTLHPMTSLASALQQDVAPTASPLERLRLAHPALAVIVGLFLIYLVIEALPPRGARARRLGGWLIAAVLVQWTIGAADVFSLAAAPAQLLHVLGADFTWIAFLLWAWEQLNAEPAEAGRAAAAPGLVPGA